jgi:molybdenum cofactor biosynthesis enzyme MoaA
MPWLRRMGSMYNMIETAFLQDAVSLILKTDQILEILRHIKVRFPSLERGTTYARATTLKRKSVEEFLQFKEAGLTRIHAGLESGSEKVLKMIKKGITPQDILEGGRKVMAAGMLSELDKFLSLTPEQKKVYALIRRSNSINYPVEIALDEKVMKEVLPEIEKLERGDLDGFNRSIETLMAYMIPQPQTDEDWD